MASLGLCITGRVTLDAVGIGLLLVLVATGIVGVDVALAGFSNGAVVTLAGLYVIGEALTRTRALEFVATHLVRRSRGSELRLVLLLAWIAAALSTLISDTVVVLVLMPLAISIARERGIPVSRMLLPIAYAALLGGTGTLVGSTINLLTSGAAAGLGLTPFGFFEMTPVAIPLIVIGVPLAVFLTRRLVPDRASMTDVLGSASTREYVTEVTVIAGAPWCGKTVSDAFRSGLEPLLVIRGDDVVWANEGDVRLEPGDVVILQGHVEQLARLHARGRLALADGPPDRQRALSYFEVAVAPRSRAIGSPVRELRLFREFGAVVIAVLRGGQHIRERASSIQLRAGDVLLLCGGDESCRLMAESPDVHLLTGPSHTIAPPRAARRALVILGLVVAAFVLAPVLGIDRRLPLPLVCVAGAMAMVAARCLSTRQAYAAVDWRILVFVVGALALGQAMESTGLAATCARAVVGALSALGGTAVLGGIVLVGMLLNQFTSPYAVILLMTPIAVAAARELGEVDVRPFVLAVAFSGSNAFATPLGHQVNLMVMAPGGYRFSDFLRAGLPLSLVAWLLVTAGLALTSAR